MAEKPRRSWMTFSLRTMFVVVTVLCLWLGWESSVVRQRRAVLNEIKGNAAFQVTTVSQWRKMYPNGRTIIPSEPTIQSVRIPMVRTWLGDEAIQEIWYMEYLQGYSEEQLARLKRAFPEAEFNTSHPEPCHPGCFPRRTLVETPQGRRLIETIEVGDPIVTVDASGETGTAEVQKVFITDNHLWEIVTEEGSLLTTKTQPLCLATGETRQAGELQPGDMILRHKGSGVFGGDVSATGIDDDAKDSRPPRLATAANAIHSVKVLSVTPTDRYEKVFNLILGDSQIFIAGDFLARSKPPAQVAVGE